jgi:O-antigen/teichoic acid export membrane protein
MPSEIHEHPPGTSPGDVPATAQAPEPSLAVLIGTNAVFGVIARLAQAGTRLVTVPIVIAHLGLGGYGIWAIIMTAAAYMRFGSIGIKSAFQKYVAEATGNGNYERANQLLSTGTAVLLVLSILGLLPISLLSRPLATAAGVPPQFLESAAHAISILAVIMLLSNFGAAFEAIVMGGHRIDLARKFSTFFIVAEALEIIFVLHFGYGLFAMAIVMGVSEIGFVACCYLASKKVVPQIHVGKEYITKTVLPELFRYAGSYQLVSVMEVIYGAIIPIALLRVFGDEVAGVYALASRLQGAAQMLPEALLLPILSGGAKIFSAGSMDEMQRLIKKSFKVTLGLTLFPLAFLSIFGRLIVYAWTGRSPHNLQETLWVLCITGLFYSFAHLSLVLYRTSGHALYDNVRQAMGILVLLTVATFASTVGYLGVLSGLACSELIGMVFMIIAIAKTYPGFRVRSMLPDIGKLISATIATLSVGLVVSTVPLPAMDNQRVTALVRIAIAIVGCVLAAGPALWFTKSVTRKEGQALLHVFVRRNFRAPNP